MGWPLIFYVYSFSGFIWVILWYLYGANCPAEHKTISIEERRYIEQSLGENKQVEVSINIINTIIQGVSQ